MSATISGSYHLSRIYCEGWNAVRKLRAGGRFDLGEAEGAALNPHMKGEERTRWADGFREALLSRSASSYVRRGKSSSPASED